MLCADYKVDKTGWGEGAWNEEPDRVGFVFGGLACLALRHPRMGCWCGYVGVPREHPLYGRPWDKGGLEDYNLEAHQGINYTASCEGLICHTPAPGMPDEVWWLGFDCGHLLDLLPAMCARERAMGFPPLEEIIDTPEWLRETYRDLAYVRDEIEHLAVQLAAMMPSHALTGPGR